MKCMKLFGAALAALCWTASVQATILVEDTWGDGNRTVTEPGFDADNDGDTESAWFNGGASTMTASAGNLKKDLTGSSANWTTYFAAEGSEVNLANTGDKLRVTWTFSLTGVGAANTSQNFRMGIVNTPVASRLVADGSPAGGTALNPYSGYAIFANMGVSPLGNTNPLQIRERIAQGGSSNILGTSSDWGNAGLTGTLNGATTGNGGFVADTPYTLVWELTRNGAGIDIDATLSGAGYNTSGSGTIDANDPDGNGFIFDTFNVRPSSEAGTASVFDSSLFRVEFIAAVPEPTTFGLFGLSALAMVLRRGR
jgi:hypothetical protein